MKGALRWKEGEDDKVAMVIMVASAVITAVTTCCSIQTMEES